MSRKSRRSLLASRPGMYLNGAVVVMASIMAIGPDAWMEWLMWGTTVLTLAEGRILLWAIALLAGAAVAWPLLRGGYFSSVRRRS